MLIPESLGQFVANSTNILAIASQGAVFQSPIPDKNVLLLNHLLLLCKQYFYQTRSKNKLGKSTK